jgi:hypothetical protein
MPQNDDTLEKIIGEMTVLVRRAAALGEARALARVVALAKDQADPKPVMRAEPVRERRTVILREKRRYPYGFVKETVQSVLSQNKQGLTKDEIVKAAHAINGATIDGDSVRNILKYMVKQKEIHRREDSYFPGPK